MQIINSTTSDISTIFDLYAKATLYQKKVFNKHWQPFERKMVEIEIKEHRQWKIVIDNRIVCIFAITYNDALIWKERDLSPSIYIHRIVTDPEFRGRFFVKNIITWASEFGKQHSKKFIRMDTFGDNEKLINYYVECGFKFLGLTTMGITPDLPKHYEGASLSLFEIAID